MSNNSQISFNLLGKTIVVPASATAPSAVQLHELFPGDDYSTEDARVQAICKATRAKDVVDAYKAAQAEQVALN